MLYIVKSCLLKKLKHFRGDGEIERKKHCILVLMTSYSLCLPILETKAAFSTCLQTGLPLTLTGMGEKIHRNILAGWMWAPCFAMRGLRPELSWPGPAFHRALCHIRMLQSKSQISSSDNSLLTLTWICLFGWRTWGSSVIKSILKYPPHGQNT